MISPNPLDLRLGAPKVVMELAQALQGLPDVHCELVGPEELGTTREFNINGWARFSAAQREFLRRRAREFDVVDYDHEHLPFARTEFDRKPVFVARSVLLVHHLERIRFPTPLTPRLVASRLFHGFTGVRFLRRRIADATRTIEQADVVNVSNNHDEAVLVQLNVDRSKIVVLPFGLSRDRYARFEAVPIEAPERPVVAFVGSFDYRKGAADFARVFSLVRAAVPGVRLLLLGTAGHFRSAADVLSFFPGTLHSQIEVHPQFTPEELPRLLARCSVGVFPSYCEGFGFGVLEMLAAAIPVVAYDAPGPPMMLGADWLVPPGDVRGMAATIIGWLSNRATLAEARRRARQTAARFDWADIARQTADAYAQCLRTRRATDTRAVLA